MASEALSTTIGDDERFRLALAIAVPSDTQMELAPRLEEAALTMGVSMGTLAALLNDPQFLKLVRGLTKAQAMLTLHGQGVSKLVDIVQDGKNADKLTAIKLLGQLTGDLKAGHPIEIKLSFEDLRKQSGKADPLSGIFDIRGAIDVDGEEVEAG